MSNIVEAVRGYLPGATNPPTKAKANTGLAVKKVAGAVGSSNPTAQYRTQVEYTSAATDRIDGVQLDQDDLVVRVGVRGVYRFKVPSSVTLTAADIGKSIIPTTTPGQVQPEVSGSETNRVGEIVEFDNTAKWVDVDLNAPRFQSV